MNRKYRRLLAAIVAVVVCLSVSASAQEDKQASAKLATGQAHFHSGSDVTFKMTLNEPLPEGAHFDVRLSPVKTDQEIAVSSGDPINKERTEFILRAKLPERAVPGDWHIKVVWFFLAGTGWTNLTLSTNDMLFVVEGPKFEIPTKAEAAIIQK
jgi:hypothetical protein